MEKEKIYFVSYNRNKRDGSTGECIVCEFPRSHGDVFYEISPNKNTHFFGCLPEILKETHEFMGTLYGFGRSIREAHRVLTDKLYHEAVEKENAVAMAMQDLNIAFRIVPPEPVITDEIKDVSDRFAVA